MAKKREPFSGVRISRADFAAAKAIVDEVDEFLLVTLKIGPIPKINTMGPYGFKVERDVSKKKEWSVEIYSLDSFAYRATGEGVTLAEAWANFKENQG